MRKLNMLWIAVLATLVLGALAASPANATKHTFHTEVDTVIVTAEQENQVVFEVQGVPVACETLRIFGTAQEETQEFVAYTETSGCTVGPVEVLVETAGCTNITDGETDKEEHATVELTCEGGNKIRVTAPACEIHIGPQVFGGGFHFANQGSGAVREVTVSITEDEIATVVTEFGFCFLLGLEEGVHKGVLEGSVLATGYKDEGVHGSETPVFTEGNQVGIWFETE